MPKYRIEVVATAYDSDVFEVEGEDEIEAEEKAVKLFQRETSLAEYLPKYDIASSVEIIPPADPTLEPDYEEYLKLKEKFESGRWAVPG